MPRPDHTTKLLNRRRPIVEVLDDAAHRIAATVAAELHQARVAERMFCQPDERVGNRRRRLEELLSRVAGIAEDALVALAEHALAAQTAAR